MSNQNNKRDKELDDFLAPIRRLEATPAQATAWRSAVKSVRAPKRLRWYQLRLTALPQLAAALMLGFVIGAATISLSNKTTTRVVETDEPSATIEHIYSKAD